MADISLNSSSSAAFDGEGNENEGNNTSLVVVNTSSIITPCNIVTHSSASNVSAIRPREEDINISIRGIDPINSFEKYMLKKENAELRLK